MLSVCSTPPPPSLSLSLSHGGRCLSVCSTRPVSQSLSRTVLLYVHRSDWDGGRGGGRESEGSTAETARKRPERPWTPARRMEVLRRCHLAIAQRLVHCAITVSTAMLGQSHKDNVRCTGVEEQPEAKEVQLSQPSSTSLLLISPGTRLYRGGCTQHGCIILLRHADIDRKLGE